MAIVSIKELVEAGVHFGHRVSRWNPKMKPYIFGKRNLIHIIDLKETIKGLIRSARFLAQVAAQGEDILFVGTKRQARNSVEAQAKRCGMAYVTERWLGGSLTNFRTITSRVRRLEELEELERSGRIQLYSKKMIASFQREMRKMRRNLEGIRNMKKLPGALVVVDPGHEKIAVAEARKLDIPVVCLTDTDSDPDLVDILTPGNDDAIRSIQLYVRRMADAIVEGKTHAPKVARKKEVAGKKEEGRAVREVGREGERPRRGRKAPTRRAAQPRATLRLPGGRVVTAEKSDSSRRGARKGGRRSRADEAPAEETPKEVQAAAPGTSEAKTPAPEESKVETPKPVASEASPTETTREVPAPAPAEAKGEKTEP